MKTVVILFAIALIWVIGLLYFRRPLMGFLRNNITGKGETEKYKDNCLYGDHASYEKNIGLSLFTAFLVAAFIIRIVSAFIFRGYEGDINCFINWSDILSANGINGFYQSGGLTDYPPGYMYVLYVLGAIRKAMGPDMDEALKLKISSVLFRLPAIIADLGTGYLVYKIGCKKFKETGAAFASALYLFCPLIILDSAVWGQVDSVFVFFVVFMMYFITEKKLIPSYFMFALAILIKPQALIFTPVLIAAIVNQVFFDKAGISWKKFWTNLGWGIAAILMIGLFMMPFGFNDALKQYNGTLNSYEYASVNAHNLWTMLGLNWQSQNGWLCGLTYRQWGSMALVIIVLGVIYLGIKYKNEESKYYFLSGVMMTLVFFFSVRMHERYIYPAAVFLFLAFITQIKKEILILYAAVSSVAFLNVAYILFVYDSGNFDRYEPVPIFISILLLCSVIYMLYVILCRYDSVETVKEKQETVSEKTKIRPSSVLAKMEKNDYIALAVIMVVYGIIAFVRLGNMYAPETGYSLVQKGAVTIDLGQDTTVSTIWNFQSYHEETKYYVEYASDVNGEWSPVMVNEDTVWQSGSVFNWNSLDVNVTARYIRITPTEENYEDEFKELVIADADGNPIMPVNSGEYSALFDEQDLFDGRDSYLNGTYFDEIYHGRTAYEMIHKEYCYENTHPPLGKIFIACGILMFGMNPFGWRFMGTIFGILMIPIIYNFAKKFFKETWISVVTTLLFTFDFMHFVQTRISTIDVFVTLFIMLSYYFMYCYTKLSFYDTPLKKTFIPLGLCGIAMGFGWACKWTGIYSSAGLCIIFFFQMAKRFQEYIYAAKFPKGKTGDIVHEDVLNSFHKKFFKTAGFCCIFFIVIPAAIYIMSYIPFNDGYIKPGTVDETRNVIERMVENQKSMFNYHSNLNSEHDFGSKWFQWPIMHRPIWYYSGSVSDELYEGISAFGNPLVWWAGIPAFIFMLYLIVKEKDRKASFLAVGYLSQFAPWFLVTRVVFIYHYFPSVPFITVMVAYSMYKIVQFKPKWKKAAYIYVGVAIALFALFYPVLSGKAIEQDFAVKWLKWFDSWVLLNTWS